MPGRYLVRAVLEGFDAAILQVTVGTRAPAAMRLTLVVAGVRQETTVSSSALQADLGAGRNLNSIVADQSALESLPVFDQDYVGTMSRFLDASAIGSDGAALVVDGVEANSVGVSPSAIQQIKINQDPYSAEFSRPGRGRIEVVTKAGTEAFRGTANVIFRDASMDGARSIRDHEAAESEAEPSKATLSGPVGDGRRSSFVASANRSEQDSKRISSTPSASTA